MRTLSLALPIALAALAAVACEKKEETAPKPAPTTVETTAATTAAPTTTTVATSNAPAKTTYDAAQIGLYQPLPAKIELPDNPLTDDKVQLGRQLFFDARLSKGQDVSCDSCHDLTKDGQDGQPISTGTKKAKGKFNTPTVFNAAGEFAQGWESRSPTVEEFLLVHVADPTIMGLEDKKLLDVVSSIPAYAAAFKKSFPDDKGTITDASVSKAMSAYLRKLLTPSKWDKFLAGDQGALSDAEKGGFGTFQDAGCPTCHVGKYVGATMNQKLGLAKPWDGPEKDDLGRFAITHQDADKGMFKVPSLRNVTKTAPYLHDGSVKTLDEMLHLMERHQLGKELSDAQVKAIETFLDALAGDAPKELLSKPTLPPNGPKTPKAE